MTTASIGRVATDEPTKLYTEPKGPHAFACKRLSILSELCLEMSGTNPPRPVKETLELLSFELENIELELVLEDKTARIGGVN
jgi:hypothetical protein